MTHALEEAPHFIYSPFRFILSPIPIFMFMFIFKFIGEAIWCDDEVGTIWSDCGEGTIPFPPPPMSAFEARSSSGDDIDDESARLFDMIRFSSLLIFLNLHFWLRFFYFFFFYLKSNKNILLNYSSNPYLTRTHSNAHFSTCIYL